VGRGKEGGREGGRERAGRRRERGQRRRVSMTVASEHSAMQNLSAQNPQRPHLPLFQERVCVMEEVELRRGKVTAAACGETGKLTGEHLCRQQT
jgi:hypothetical protein